MPKPANCPRAEPEFSTNHSYPASKPSCQDSECPMTPPYRSGRNHASMPPIPALWGRYGFIDLERNPCLGGCCTLFGVLFGEALTQSVLPAGGGVKKNSQGYSRTERGNEDALRLLGPKLTKRRFRCAVCFRENSCLAEHPHTLNTRRRT